MSIATQMKSYILQESREIKTPLGNLKDEWVQVGIIDIAMYTDDSTIVVNGTKYVNNSITGLTYKVLNEQKKYRVLDKAQIYSVESVVPGRLSKLTLKNVDLNG